MKYTISPIGICESCFQEKLLIPRQAGLVPSSHGRIILNPSYRREDLILPLKDFSHLYITWVPHLSADQSKSLVKPPRLGGNKKISVFATRSPFRPNPICHSIVELDSIQNLDLIIKNHDLLDQTPIIDIKPYLPIWDSIPEASHGWLDQHQESHWQVQFSPELNPPARLKQLLIETLSLNPLPRYKIKKASYGVKLAGFEVKFVFDPKIGFLVTDIVQLPC